MKIRKWNEKTKDYEPYEIPNDWKCPLYSEDMNLIINCISCGTKMPFGDGYTSQRYHNDAGFGYYECEKCYYEYLPIYLASRE